MRLFGITTQFNLTIRHFFIKSWIKDGITKMHQLFDNQGNLLSINVFKNHMPNNANVLFDYFVIRNALPTIWKQKHGQDSNHNTDITFNGIVIDLCTTMIFRKAINKSIAATPICQNLWTKRFPNSIFNRQYIWKTIPNCTHEARLITLNWKILHNIYPTKILLHKIGKESSNICNTCNVIDYTEHFFYFCKKVKFIWDHAEMVISDKLSFSFKFDVEKAIFGVHNCKSSDNNFIKLCGRYC